MSDFLQLRGIDLEQSNREAEILHSSDLPADLFDGTDVTSSWGRGASELARTAAVAGSLAPIAYDYLFTDDADAQDWYFKNVVDDPYHSAQEYYKPDAGIVGAGGSVLNSVVEMLPQLVGGGATLVASTQINTGIDLINQGVDATTAQGVGAIQGLAAGAGVWLPVMGNTLATKIAYNAMANPAVNMLARGASNLALDSQGYTKEAEQYDAFDAQTIAVDAIMGAVFGGADAMLRGSDAGMDWNVVPQKLKDSVVAAKAYTHRTVESAPGKPLDIKSQNAHLDAVDTAVTQLIEGKKVDVSAKVEGAQFAPRQMAQVDNSLTQLDEFVGMPVVQDMPPVAIKPSAVPDDVVMGADVASVDPEISQARQAVENYGDYEIEVSSTVSMADGTTTSVKRKASEVVADIDAQFKQETQIADAILAASNCYIGGL